MFKDGASATYDGSLNQFFTNAFGYTDSVAGTKNAGGAFEMFNFGTTASFAQKADNSVAGEMRDCGECHVGGGMMEYVNNTVPSTDYSVGVSYDPAKRTSLRDYAFGGAITAFNALVDIFNPDTSKRGDVVVQDYSQTGVLEMDCLVCHMNGYNWGARKEAVRKGEFDASRPAGAGLVSSIVDGTTVVYNSSVTTDTNNQLVVDLSTRLKATPDSTNCASCHQSQYNVDWKKRGEQWLPGTEVHIGFGCMACHERNDKANPTVGTEGTINGKLGLCDPAKGGNSAFDALWNKLDTVNFKNCAGCHEPTGTPSYETYGAPSSAAAHAAKGLTARIAFDKNGNPASHMDLIDCTACHIKKTFDGGAFVDGTGADAEGRVALHDEPQVARDMTNGNALYWDNGKLYAANLLTSFFVRDMNGMDANADPTNTTSNGLDANNDGRNAGMDPLLQTHINNINIANGLKAVTMEQEADGSWVNETEMGAHLTAISNGIKAQLGNTSAAPVLPKVSFLMVPFKASHNIVPTATAAWGKNGCSDCHGASKGFYNGTYPIKGNMDGTTDGTNYVFRFKSDQVTAFTKVNGLLDVTDSHPNVVTKKGDRTVPIPMLTKFDNPYTAGSAAVANQTLRNIERSEVIYEQTFQARDTAWYTSIAGAAPAAACSGPTSPFYCADPLGNASAESVKKSHATSTKGWLLKIEVRMAGDTNAANITFRTAQLGKDNAASMTDVFSALPASFRSNTDFTVTESGGALTITAQAGKEIRISPQTDVGPLGLKGKLWKNDPIIRGANSYGTRDAYVAYLNSITAESAGIGIDPVATVNALSDADTTTGGVQVVQNSPVNMSAADAQVFNGNPVGTSTYTWSFSDGTPSATGQNAIVTFGSLGSKTITLKVTDEEGKVSQATTTVTVVVPPITVDPLTATHGASQTFTFTSLPAGWTKMKIYWGDGSYSFATTATPAHTYAAAGSKSMQIYVYNSSSRQIGYKQATITVN